MNEALPLEQILAGIRNLGDVIRSYGSTTFTLRSRIFPPISWKEEYLEAELMVKLPPDLKQFWHQASRLHLFEEIVYGQWGLIIRSPAEVIDFHKENVAESPDDFRQGDLIVGEFVGDPDLVVVRCNPNEDDFNSIVIVKLIDSRDYWPIVAKSFTEFLEKCVDSVGEKYWAKKPR